MISAFANPARFMALSAWLMPALAAFAILLFAVGLPWGLAYAPADYQHGETVRIMYVHVPAAWWSLFAYAALAGASLVYLVWRHVLADVAARAIAPIGAGYAALCLITGSLWGAPAWGTFWEWGDARLVSMLVLFLTLLGYMALRAAIDDEDRAALMGAILALAGALNLPVVHWSVDYLQTLHQPASSGDAIYPSLRAPLWTMAAAYGLAFGALTLAGMRAEIYRRRAAAAAARRARSS